MEQWFISIFGVCHYEKPGKIQIAVDSSAQCNVVSLNDVMLTGTDLSNSLLGVHKQSFTITSDSNVFHISGFSCHCSSVYLFIYLVKYFYSSIFFHYSFHHWSLATKNKHIMSLRFDIGKSFFYSALYTTLFQSSLAEEEKYIYLKTATTNKAIELNLNVNCI